MAIRFFCVCGHHLKARDEMAGRRTMCPACGAPVGVPSLKPTHRGTQPQPHGSLRGSTFERSSEPMPSNTPACEQPDARETAAGSPQSAATGKERRGRIVPRREPVRSVRLVTLRERQRAAWRKPHVWELERRWYQSLKYPLREFPVLLSLAVTLTVASGLTFLLLPRALQGNFVTNAISPLIIPLLIWSLIPLLVLGHACLFLSRVSAYAAAGQVKYVGWSDLDPGPPLRSLGRWIGCFLCGPVLPAWAALAYWVRCGTLTVLDYMILAELVIPAAGYWVIAVLVVSRTERLADANPLGVLAAMRRLGNRTLAVTVLGAAILGVHLWLGMFAIEELHRNLMLGFALLGVCWLSALFFGAFVLRLAGLWHHQRSWHVPPATTPRWAIPGLSFVSPPFSAR